MDKKNLMKALSVPSYFGSLEIHTQPWAWLWARAGKLTVLYAAGGLKAMTSVDCDEDILPVKVNVILIKKSIGVLSDDISILPTGSTLTIKSKSGKCEIPLYDPGKIPYINLPETDPDAILDGDTVKELVSFATGNSDVWFREQMASTITHKGGAIVEMKSTPFSLPERMFGGLTGISGFYINVYNMDEFVVLNWDSTWVVYRKFRDTADGRWDEKLLAAPFDLIGKVEPVNFSPFKKLGINEILWTPEMISEGVRNEVSVSIPFEGDLSRTLRMSVPKWPKIEEGDMVEVYDSPGGVKFKTGRWSIFTTKIKAQ